MAPAVERSEPLLLATTFSRGHASVVANVDGAVHDDPSDWPGLLVRQLTEPVRFEACVARAARGVDRRGVRRGQRAARA